MSLLIGSLLLVISGSSKATEAGEWPTVVELKADRGLSTEVSRTAVQADGKVVAAGYSESRRWVGVTVARFLVNGQPDPSFGIGGQMRFRSDRFWFLYDMVIQPDGTILILGVGSESMSIARLTSEGRIDVKFAKHGIASVKQERDDGLPPSNITLDQSGGIVVAFTSHRRDKQGRLRVKETVIWKLKADGTRDESFGMSGVVRRVGPWSRIVVGSIARPDETFGVIAASRTKKQTWRGYTVLKPVLMNFDSQGHPDRTAGGKGIQPLKGVYGSAGSGGGRACQPVQAHSDREGRLLLLTNCVSGRRTQTKFGVVARYSNNGDIDLSFGLRGTRIISSGGVGWGAFVVAPEGSITLSASSFYPKRYVLGRLEGDGSTSKDLGPKGIRAYRGLRSTAWGGMSINQAGRIYSPVNRGKRWERYGIVSFGKFGH